MTAVSMMALLGFVFLTYNVTRLYIVKNEMQNGADAAALAGAACLNRLSAVGSLNDCEQAKQLSLNWVAAKGKAESQLGQNKADNNALTGGDVISTVVAGYWNLADNPASVNVLKAQTTSPLIDYDVPAVKVTIQKNVNVFATSIFGLETVSLTSSAIAVLASPDTLPVGNLMPIAINKCMFDLYWDSLKQIPKNAPNNTALNGVPQKSGEPYKIRIGIDETYQSTCTSGQWAYLKATESNLSDIQKIIANGNSEPIKLNSKIFIMNGNATSLFDVVSPTPRDIVILVVNINTGGNYKNFKGETPVVTIAGFHLTAVGKKYIEGNFTTNLAIANATGVGATYYGVYTPPRLAQ